MCNLYRMTSSQRSILEAAPAVHDHTGNVPVLLGIFPDYLAPVVRNGADGSRELVMARWGMPSSQKALLMRRASAATRSARKSRTSTFMCFYAWSRIAASRTSERQEQSLDPLAGSRASLPGAFHVVQRI